MEDRRIRKTKKNLKTTPSMAALVEDIRKLIREGK